MNILLQGCLLGIGATLFMDLWALFQKRLFKIPSLNYGLVGRWLGYIIKGQYFHNTIIESSPITLEGWFGWAAHYLIGVIFALVFVMVLGTDWIVAPTFLPALVLGVVTVLMPFFIMQPGFGFGVAASKTMSPNTVRVRSLIAHVSFGVGIYITELIISSLMG